MNSVNEILENGSLYQYVLGELSATEVLELEALIAENVELQNELALIEETLESVANENKITPPASIKNHLVSKISNRDNQAISLPNYSKLYYAAAAIAIIFMVSTTYLYLNLSELQNRMVEVNDSNTLLKENLETLLTDFETTQDWYQRINQPEVEKYTLTGNDLSPNSVLISYINPVEKIAFVNVERLSELDEDHDYQLWADVDGEMLNMGVLNSDNKMMAVTYYENATSLNITIEPKGGSKHPTVTQLISNIYI